MYLFRTVFKIGRILAKYWHTILPLILVHFFWHCLFSVFSDLLSVYSVTINTIVSVDCNVVEALLKMPHVFTHAEYTIMLHVTTSVMIVFLLLLENIIDAFLYTEFRIGVFFKIFNRLRECGTLPSVHIIFE